MGSSSSKGDKSSSQIKLPAEVEALAKRNLAAAERAGQIGYVPYQGPTIAALNPLQVGAMQQNEQAMRAFGMQPQSVAASIPKPTTYAGGIQGYDPMGLYMQSLGKIDPAQKTAIESFVNPQGVTAANQAAAGGKGGGGAGNANGMHPLFYARSPQGEYEAKMNRKLSMDPFGQAFMGGSVKGPGSKGGSQ